MSFDTDVCFKSLCALFYKFVHQQNEDTAKELEREMDVLIAITSHGTAIQDFAPSKLLHAETLTVLVSILNESSLKVSLYLKAMVLLFHLAKDEDTRESLHHTFKVVPTLASFLLHRCSPTYEQLSMQCLQLLQRITYSTKISCPVAQLEQLVKNLIEKVLCPEHELTLPCLGVLANLTKNSDRVQNYIKSLDSLRRLYRALFAFMSHANWTVIVFALTIITALALHDHVGEKVFNSKNIGQTFQLLFNIVVNENQLLTRRYAVDLFIDLLQEEKFRNYLASYHNFRDYIANVLQQLDEEDMESSLKILELLQSMTKIPELRRPICLAIRGMRSNEDEETQLPDDAHALLLQPLLRVASLRGGHSSNSVVKTALSILLDLLKEVTSSQVETLSVFPLDMITHALNDHLLLIEESADVEVPLHVRAPVMAKALIVLLFMYRSDLTRHHLLNTVDTNNILNLIRKLSLDYASELRREKLTERIQRSEVTSVFIFGGVLLNLMCEMTANGKNKWKSTMSSVDYSPFLASGLCSSDQHLVKESFNLIADLDTIGAACRESISQLLSLHNAQIGGIMKSCQDQRVVPEDQLSFLGYSGRQSFPPEPVSTSARSKLDPAVSQLAKKIKNGLDLEDSTMSEIMEIYEHKLLCSETNETHLQDLLEAKTLALNQADLLLSQYRCRQARSDAECLKLRSIVNETERKLEKHVQEIAGQREENKQKKEKITELQREVASLRVVEGQHQELRILHQETSQRLNQQLIELEKEKQTLTMKLHDKEQACSELRKQISCKESELKEKKEENEALQKTLDEERSRSTKAKAELCAKVSRMELLCQQRESELRENEKRILDLQGEVDKHAQIAAMIHNLSSGKLPLSKFDFGS